MGEMDQGEDLFVGDTVKDSNKSADKGSDSTVEMANVLGTLGAANILTSGGLRTNKRDFEIAMIHAERELEMMITELDRINEMVAKYLSENEQAELDCHLMRRWSIKFKGGLFGIKCSMVFLLLGLEEVLRWLFVAGYLESMKYHSLDKRLIDLMMMVLVRRTEECDMMLRMEKSNMLMLVAKIEFGDKTADDVDKVACSADVVKSSKVDLKFA
nr:hypothetical protein [Tanacetum cinerariifolium]